MTTLTYLFFVVYAVIFLARNALGAFGAILLALVAVLAHLKLGLTPALPSSVFSIFLWFAIVATAVYVVASEKTMRDFWAPIHGVIVNRDRMPALAVAILVLSAIAAWGMYELAQPDVSAPARFRVVHPAPPGTVTSHGETYETATAVNPYRELKTTNPEEFAKHVTNGRRVYYENCYFCHGDRLAADGHYAEMIYPRPISFRDANTIPLFTEVFLFWRVAKGGPGLPGAATPWDSMMPAWEDFMSNEDMWDVILYLYERTGFVPRAQKGQ